jgi:hypothetical protein
VPENATNRIIGIRHRTKMTAEQEPRPTEVVILQNGVEVARYKLEDEQAELDFLLGLLPCVWEDMERWVDQRDLNKMPLRHLKLKAVDADESKISEHYRMVDKKRYRITHYAIGFDGLKAGDTVAMALGGSGDYLAFALARRAEEVGATIIRLPSFALKERRGDGKKDDDAYLIATLAQEEPSLFYDLRSRDKELIRIREAYFMRIDAMKERIACEQRLRQRFIGQIFCNPAGRFPEGLIEKQYDELKANDIIFRAMSKEEGQRERELQKLVEASDVWQEVFGDIEGMGWAIASRIIAGVGDIRRFETCPKFKAFCGVHVLSDGRFPRRRQGELANWHPDLRQALFLFGDQANRRPDSVWGKKLREYKVKLRAKHPEVVVGEGGKKKYTDGHIHKMALWRTRTKFAEYLYERWKRFEKKSIAAAVPISKAA